MRKAILVVILALAVSGCAGFQQALSLTWVSVANPVTRDMLYEVENSAVIVFAGLQTYKRSCQRQLIADSCRGMVASIQVYTRRLPSLLRSLRQFVRQNDQVNARVVYNSIVDLIGQAKAFAAVNNMQVAQ